MRLISCLAAVAALALGAAQASAQSAVFDFQDGTDQGFGGAFGNDASASYPIVNIGGSLRMGVTNTSSFQEAGRESGNPAEPFYQAMNAASANEAGYIISYDYYIDTSATAGSNGTFLQLGTFVNTGNGYYAQYADNNELSLDGTQLASGQVFSGTVSQTFAAKGYDLPAAQTFFRLGLIVNSNGTNAPVVYYDNIRIAPVPEPTTLAALGAAGGLLLRRRRA